MDVLQEPECSSCNKKKKLQKGALISGAIASLVIVFFVYKTGSFFGVNTHLQPVVELPKYAAVAIGPYPASPISIAQNDGSFAPSQIDVSGKKLYIVDSVRGTGNTTFFLLIEPVTKPVSNLYQKNESGQIVQVTNSETAKYELSVDASTGRSLYVALKPASIDELFKISIGDIVEYDPSTQKETVIAQGHNPHFLSNGEAFIYESNGSLRLHSLQNKTDVELFSLSHMGAYAINVSSARMAVYNIPTHSVDMYAIVNNSSLSYISSNKITEYPKILGFFDGSVYSLYGGAATTTMHTVNLEQVVSHKKSTINTNVAGWPQRAYDYIP